MRMGHKGRCAGKLDVMHSASLVQGSDASIRLWNSCLVDVVLHTIVGHPFLSLSSPKKTWLSPARFIYFLACSLGSFCSRIKCCLSVR